MNDYILLTAAFTDLDQVRDYISQESAEAADRFVDRILDTVETLAALPHQGHRRSDLTNRNLRFQRVGEYLIAYAPEESPLLFVAIVHGRRSTRTIAAILASREG